MIRKCIRKDSDFLFSRSYIMNSQTLPRSLFIGQVEQGELGRKEMPFSSIVMMSLELLVALSVILTASLQR